MTKLSDDEDVRDFDRISAAIERGDEETLPAEVVHAILDGENSIKAWREYRGLTQQQLADSVDISKPYLSQIETGKRTGMPETLSAIAKALSITLDQAVIFEED